MYQSGKGVKLMRLGWFQKGIGASYQLQPPWSIQASWLKFSTASDTILRIKYPLQRNSSNRKPKYTVSPRVAQNSYSVRVKQQHLSNMFATLDSVSRLLEAGSRNKLSPIQVSQLLERLGQLCSGHNDDALGANGSATEEEILQLLDDDRFMRLGEILHQGVLKLSVPSMLSSLDCLLRLSPDKDLFIMESIEMQVLWLLKKMPIGQVFRVLDLHSGVLNTDLRKSVYAEALQVLEQRWAEITNPKDMVTLFYIAADGKMQNFLEKLEERALDVCRDMSQTDLYRVIYVLSKNERRNTPLLRALAYQLKKKDLKLSLVHLANLTFACARLNYIDQQLMENLTKAILEKLQSELETPTSVITSLIRSISMLRWRDVNLIGMLTENLLHRQNNVKATDVCGLLLTCGHLNYLPAVMKENLDALVSRLEGVREQEPRLWLDVVWSLTILGHCNSHLTASVLSQQFLQSLQARDLQKNSPVHLKLVNVDSAAECDLAEYTGPRLPDNYIHNNNIQVPVRSSRPLQDSVLVALSNIAPSDKYIRTDVPTNYGYFIDIELVVNDKGEPQPLEQLEVTARTPEAPANLHRIAMKVLDFQDMTLGTIAPVGLHVMAARHIEHHGYITVMVPYTEISRDTKVVKLVQNLQRLIQTRLSANSSQH